MAATLLPTVIDCLVCTVLLRMYLLWSESRNFVALETGIENSEFIYDLTGRRLRSECMETLPHGVYIIEGKKMVKL